MEFAQLKNLAPHSYLSKNQLKMNDYQLLLFILSK